MAINYFTAFVVTAPIAAAMYAAKDWQADAAAEGTLSATDPAACQKLAATLLNALAESLPARPTP